MIRRGRAVPAAALLLMVGLSAPATAEPEEPTLQNLPSITDEMVRESIIDLTPVVVDLKPVVEGLETESTDGVEKVLTLNSDILFAFDKAVITPAATSRVGELVKPLPQKAKVSIGGHTDSLGTDARNLPLSLQRAQAVAAAITRARPDLVLTVKGFGKTKPVASNGSPAKDDPQGRAKNRRVEIRYAG